MTAAPMPVTLLEWKPVARNSLVGFATIRLGAALRIADIAIHSSRGKRWAQLPSKPVIGSDGNIKRDEAGKIQYVPILKWIDRQSADRFSESVIAAVDREYPNAATGAA